jgi:hypothetical protein
MTTVTATFTPQAWQGDHAIDIDPRGETTWDASAAWDELPAAYRVALILAAEDASRTLDIDDRLRDDPAAPAWVHEHRGPFSLWLDLADVRPTPADIIEATGAVVDFLDPTPISEGGMVRTRYRVAIEVGDNREAFDYTASANDYANGIDPDPADVLGCLFSDYTYADETPDELWREMGDNGEPPSHWVDMAAALADNAAKLRRLFGRNVDTFAERIEW